MTDREELHFIRQDYKKILKAELVLAVEWMLDYIEDMELPSSKELHLIEALDNQINEVNRLNGVIVDLQRNPLWAWLSGTKLGRRLFT